VDLHDLTRANGLREQQPIRIGQRLTIPSASFGANRQEPPSMAEIVLGPPPEAHRLALLWPVPALPVASAFGPRGPNWHGGVDLMAESGTPIRAAAPGVVIASGWERGYGNVVKIWHTPELLTVYAHNQENHVRPGDWVERGRVIGTVGNTGRATAPHLHFEVRLDGKKYDPMFWLPEPGATDLARLGAGGSPAAR
jgi:murein DD-endopeptidase MepM/ murein hydrolase activator NlpD